MSTNIQAIAPLWESFPGTKVQGTEKAQGGSMFADIFKSAIENVRASEDVVAKAEDQLSTGTLDNPAQLSLELYKASASMSLLVNLRQKALDAEGFSILLDYQNENAAGKVFNKRIRDRICGLSRSLGKAAGAEEFGDCLTRFYQEFGVGKLGLHKAFRVEHPEGEAARIVPISNIAHVRLDDLVGYEQQKKKLRDNTEAFVSGRKANNCLLFGDAGTGKSSCIKAIANEYYHRGLRVIEVYKHQFQDLNEVIGQIKGRNYKFIIFMDDLSFEDFEIEYKYLKAVIEGGLEKKPENVLIYATSNRRHLIRENYGDKTEDGHLPEIRQDMHTSDTVQEKLSLVYRFGVTIYFGAPDKRRFQEIVGALADRHGIEMPREELLAEANKWELSHGGLSGRTAQQFIDYILGMRNWNK